MTTKTEKSLSEDRKQNSLTGKVSVVHYLNTKLKPLKAEKGDKYPVYMRLGFNRKQTAIRSSFVYFLSDTLNDPYEFDFVLHEDMFYLTEYEFELAMKNPTKKLGKAFTMEANAATQIISYYGSLAINIVAKDTSKLYEVLIHTFNKVLDTYFLTLLCKDLFNKHGNLALVIDFDKVTFNQLFEVLNYYGNENIKSWIEPHKEKYHAMNFLWSNVIRTDENLRIYNFFIERFKDGIPIWNQVYEGPKYLQFIKQSIIAHFEQTLSKQPEILKILKTEVEKVV